MASLRGINRMLGAIESEHDRKAAAVRRGEIGCEMPSCQAQATETHLTWYGRLVAVCAAHCPGSKR